MMNTPPPESDFIKPEPTPSLSMPVLQPLQASSPPATTACRPRRHTIARPDIAQSLLSDSDEGDQQDQTLDRISDILATLIQEANEAVHDGGITFKQKPKAASPAFDHDQSSPFIIQSSPYSVCPSLEASTSATSSSSPQAPTSSRTRHSRLNSRLPRPTRSTRLRWIHDRHSSLSSSASSASLFSPTPVIESPATASSIEQSSQLHHPYDQDDYDAYKTDINDKDDLSPVYLHSPGTDGVDADDDDSDLDDLTADDNYNASKRVVDHHETRTPPDYIDIHRQKNATSERPKLSRFDNPLMESFRRLDSSMAMVESLSRDLANDNAESSSSFISATTSTSKLTLLLLPLLHIPHALITTVFDSLTDPRNTNTTEAWKLSSFSSSSAVVNNNSSSLSGMVAWAFFFTLANVVVTWSGVTAPHWLLTQPQQQRRLVDSVIRPRRLSLPGSYQPSSELQRDLPGVTQTNNHRMIRSSRPAPINTSLSTKKSPAHYSIRRTPVRRTTPLSSSSSSRKRTSSYHHHCYQQQQQQRHRHHRQHNQLASTSMTTSNSNDRSYTLAIQQSRIWQQSLLEQDQQQIWENEEKMNGTYDISRTIRQQQRQPSSLRRYSF